MPTLMAVFSVLLSMLAIQVDARFADTTNQDFLAWLFDNEPEGAREVLSTIAGSMITVAGVVFSITLVTVSNAAFQFGPRLLTNFMRDRANQVTMGTFIATFLYCLMVLRAVQSAPDGASGEDVSPFVPHIALLGAIVLAICSIAVLIYFIHHVPRSIHVSRLVANIGTQLCQQLDQRFPVDLGDDEPAETDDADRKAFERELKAGRPVKAKSSGYVRVIDTDGLMDCASGQDLKLQLFCKPGKFITKGEPLMGVRTYGGEDIPEDTLHASISLSMMRTPMQDLEFLTNELSEIAMRALSPGINDPITAITALDWLGAALSLLMKRESVSGLRRDDDGAIRILAPVAGFADILEAGPGSIMPSAARNFVAGQAFLRMTDKLLVWASDLHKPKIESLRQRFMDIAKAELSVAEVKLLKAMRTEA